MTEQEKPPRKPPSLFRNYISFSGAAIGIASLASITLLFLIELTGRSENAYLGIFTYLVLPTVLVFGLSIVPVGMLFERRRRRRLSPADIAAYPSIDLNDPRRRRTFFTFLGMTFVLVFVSAFGSYRTYEYTETVNFCGESCHTPMHPEYTAYLASPHARVRCVDCHVGPGAGWYVRSKLSGAYQLYSVTFNKYPRPITTPVHNLRPAPETCEQCHWPEKFFGAQLKTFSHYAYDEKNTMRETRMLINVGGGSPQTGQVAGIHWHMNIGNEVTYIATDDHRQSIPWVRVKDRQGNITEYLDRNKQLTAAQLETAPKRRMDCVDCHNRPAHVYLPPDVAVDRSLVARKMDASLPYLKREAIAVLTKQYQTTDEALKAIAASLDGFYRTNYPDVYTQKAEGVKVAIGETQRIFQTYFFPEMKTDWQTHPNNIGHLYSQGCFRCHDGEHVSGNGKVLSNDCNTCHTVIYDSAGPPEKNLKTGPFEHPVNLGGLSQANCTVCHKADKGFKHPLDLGDLSGFQCVECHQKKSQANVASVTSRAFKKGRSS